MAPEKIHSRYCMLYEFRQGKKATEATATNRSVYGEDALSVGVCQQWFVKFRNKNFDLEDEQRSGKPRQLTADDLQALLDEDPRQSTRELAETLHVDQSTVARRLHEMGRIQKVGRMGSSQIVREEHGRPQKHLCHVARETTTGKFFAQ